MRVGKKELYQKISLCGTIISLSWCLTARQSQRSPWQEHSLTALSESKVIGYLSFDLKEDTESDVSLLQDGTYTVLIDQGGAGVELNLVLNEQEGTIVPTGAQKIAHNLWWLWLLLALLAICIVACIVFYCKKKKKEK